MRRARAPHAPLRCIALRKRLLSGRAVLADLTLVASVVGINFGLTFSFYLRCFS